MAEAKNRYTYRKYLCREIDHFTQRHKPFTVHVIQETKDCLEIYWQKDGYPMRYAFGIPVDGWNVEEAFQVGWKYIRDNREFIEGMCN